MVLSRGRHREKTIDSVAAWMDIYKTASAISAAKDRAVWKDMIANALGRASKKKTILVTFLFVVIINLVKVSSLIPT